MTVLELLQDLGVQTSDSANGHCRPGWVNLDCPFCGTVGKYHLGYNLSHGYFHCWRCGSHSVRQVVKSLGASKQQLAELELVDSSSHVPYLPQVSGHYKPPHSVGPLLEVHKRYLRQRGFDPDYLEQVWRVGGIGLDTRYAWRLFIPIYALGRPVSWTTRAITDQGLRYLSAPPECQVLSPKQTLYGLDLVTDRAIVVEGPADAWAVGPGAVATFGCTFSLTQVRLLSTLKIRVIAYDRDAQAQAHKLANHLLAFPGKTYVVQLSAKDPAECPKDEIKRLRDLCQLT